MNEVDASSSEGEKETSGRSYFSVEKMQKLLKSIWSEDQYFDNREPLGS